jgi:glutamate racemase
VAQKEVKFDSRPIGLFDSGLGGLTVLKSLTEALPNESFLYLGDVARLPYGNKSPETIRKYGEQILHFLIERDVKMLIIACNTASTVFLGERLFNGRPLFNVIEPGAQAAITATRSKKVGVIATSTTVQGQAYTRTLKHLDPSVQTREVACPLFVPLAEEGMAGDEVTKLLAQRYLKDLKEIDTLILGCTHYPILKTDIAHVTGPDVTLIESGKVLGENLQAHFALLGGSAPVGAKSKLTICTTDVTAHFTRLAQVLMAPRTFGELERVVL